MVLHGISGSLKLKEVVRRWPNPAGLLIALLSAGLLIRLLAVARRGFESQIVSEMYLVALVFGRTGEIAGAFVPGSGPTAHVSPLPPIMAGLVYRFTGNGGLLSEVCLTLLSLGIIFGGFFAMYRAFRLTGMQEKWALGAIAFLMLVPLYYAQEGITFRTWEGGQATLLFALGLLILALAERQDRFSRASLAGMAAVIAIAFLVSPIVGLSLIICATIFYLRRRQLVKAAGTGALLCCIALLALTPWAIRNERALGSPVLLRSNFGLVLASAYHESAYQARSGAERMVEFPRYLGSINPYWSRPITGEMIRRGGEVVYNDHLKNQALGWIKANPGKAANLALRYAGEFLFTPPYTWGFYQQLTPARRVLAYLSATITMIGLLGLLVCLLRRERLALYGLVYIGSATALYALSQPLPRYHYIIHPSLVFFAFRGMELLLRNAALGRRTPEAVQSAD